MTSILAPSSRFVHKGRVDSGDTNRFISVITVKGRKIVHWRDYLDPLLVIAALGGNTPKA